MKTLQQIISEGLLDDGLEKQIDKHISSDFYLWIMREWKDIKFEDILQPDPRFKRVVCTDITDRDKIEHLLQDFAYDAKKKGRKCKCPNKEGEQLVFTKQDKTLICVQYLRTGDIEHIGIGNMAQDDALCIESDLVPIDGKTQLRLTCLCHENKGQVYPTFSDIVRKYSQHRRKLDYYLLPGECYQDIKKAILN